MEEHTTSKVNSKRAPARQPHIATTNLPSLYPTAPTLDRGQFAPLSSHTIQRAMTNPKQLSAENVLALQRTMGNQAVQRLLRGTPAPQTDKPPIVQPKLRVGPARDRYEQEADQIARQVVEKKTPTAHQTERSQPAVMRSPSGKQSSAPVIQRWPWSKKTTTVEKEKDEKGKDSKGEEKGKEKEETKTLPKGTAVPYSRIAAKVFKPSTDKPAESDEKIKPEYVNDKLADQTPDEYVITTAVSQDQNDWWQEIQKLRKVGAKKMITSPKQLFKKAKKGDLESHLISESLKSHNEMPEEEKEQNEKIEKLKSKFHSVGHTWVRFMTKVKGELKELYSFGFYPANSYDMQKYVPGSVHHPDRTHEKDKLVRYYDKTVTSKQYGKGLSLAAERYANPPDYHLMDYNCTKFVREILQAAGRNYPGKGVFPGFVFTPGALYETLGNRMGKKSKSKKAYEEDPHAKVLSDAEKERNRSPFSFGLLFNMQPTEPPKPAAPRPKPGKVYKTIGSFEVTLMNGRGKKTVPEGVDVYVQKITGVDTVHIEAALEPGKPESNVRGTVKTEDLAPAFGLTKDDE